MKNIFLLAFTFFITICNGQHIIKHSGSNIIFEPNVNHKARLLKQGLNKYHDSLILESLKKPISQIDIFNEDFLESFDVNSNKTKIDLNALPAGNFIVQARVGRKRIVMYLEKKEGIDLASVRKQEELDNQELEDTISESKKKKKKKKKNAIYYWVVYESNSNVGSRKSMKLVYKNELSGLIEKNKYELLSDVGNDNTLSIYAIYNKNKFIDKQYSNPKYYKSVKKSKVFNVIPFYSSKDVIVNETSS